MTYANYERQTYFDLVDRSDWQSVGDKYPWVMEPDELCFVSHDYLCAITRTRLGNLCGYVSIPVDHIYYGKHHNAIFPHVDIHGGLSYSGFNEFREIFYPEPPNLLWWFGYDCAHAYDLVPGLAHSQLMQSKGIKYPRGIGTEPTYKTIAFCKLQCTRMARQLKNAK